MAGFLNVSDSASKSKGHKHDNKGGSSNTAFISSNWSESIIFEPRAVIKTYIIRPGDTDDISGHTIREAFVAKLQLRGCVPATVTWEKKQQSLNVVFTMPRAKCTLRDILEDRYIWKQTKWSQMTVKMRFELAETVALDVLVALGGLCSAGFSHSDLHDANVVLGTEAGKERFLLIDFGFCCRHSERKRRNDLLQWCPPPERLGKWSKVSPNADTWSVGYLFCLCLANRMPDYTKGGLAPVQIKNPLQNCQDWKLLYLSPGDCESARVQFLREQTDWKPWHKHLLETYSCRLDPCSFVQKFFPNVSFDYRAATPMEEFSQRLKRTLIGASPLLSPLETEHILRELESVPLPSLPPKPAPMRSVNVSLSCCLSSRRPALPDSKAVSCKRLKQTATSSAHNDSKPNLTSGET
jgi:serine/threonine protein kinase